MFNYLENLVYQKTEITVLEKQNVKNIPTTSREINVLQNLMNEICERQIEKSCDKKHEYDIMSDRLPLD